MDTMCTINLHMIKCVCVSFEIYRLYRIHFEQFPISECAEKAPHFGRTCWKLMSRKRPIKRDAISQSIWMKNQQQAQDVGRISKCC